MSNKQPITLNPLLSQDTEQACIANISTPERRKRLTFAVISFVISLALLAILVATGTDRVWRLPLFLLFAGAGVGFFQWYDKTCIALANVNARKIGDRMEKIEDASELAQVKKQARRVQLKGVMAAVCLTAIALLLPVVS